MSAPPEFSAPPYPAETKAGGFAFELNIERMHQSDTWAIAEAHLRPYLLMVWVVSWTQLPAGSLPYNDAVIASRIGMSTADFVTNKEVLLRGWWRANDGRLYHPVLTELVLGMIARKARKATNQANHRNRQRQRGSLSACDGSLPSQPSDADGTGHTDVTDPLVTGHRAPTDCTTTTITTPTTTQEHMPELKGSGQMKVDQHEKDDDFGQAGVEVLIMIPLKDGSEYAISGSEVAEWKVAFPNKDVTAELRQARAWCLSNPTRRKTRGRVRGFLNGWLARNFSSEQASKRDYFNPSADKFKNIKGGAAVNFIEIEPGVRAAINRDIGVVWRRDENCQKHGLFEGKAFVLGAKDTEKRPDRWHSKCPKCLEQEKAERERLEHAEQLRVALAARIANAGIPYRFQTATLASYVATNAGQEHALQVARDYAKDFRKIWECGRGLLLLGNLGNGKTHLAVGIAYEVMEQGYPAIFTTAAGMLAKLKSTWGKPTGSAEQEVMIQEFAGVSLLLIDEVGSTKCVGRERELMTRILGLRHDAALPTIFTGNLTPAELPEYLGEYVVSRLRESATEVVGFSWEDYRPIKARMAA